MRQSSLEEQGVVLGIDHVQLGFALPQQAQIQQFYGQLLGLPQLVSPAAGSGHALAYLAGGQRIDLVPRLSTQHACECQGHMALRVAGLAVLHQRLLDHGVAALAMVSIAEGLRFYVKDPAGNTLELIQPLAISQATVYGAKAAQQSHKELALQDEVSA